MNAWLKRAIWTIALLLVIFVLVRALRGTPVIVDAATIVRGPLVVSVDDDGRTRVRERYTISAPVAGRLLRVPLEPGDEVLAYETLVAEFEPTAAPLLDARSRAEAEARVRRAEAAIGEVDALVVQAEVELAFAENELQRRRGLVEKEAEPAASLDLAQRDQERATEALRAARSRAQVARFEAELARATLTDPAAAATPFDEESAERPAPPSTRPSRVLLRSPIDGAVLSVFEESARTLPAGAPILEVGDLGRLEIVADYLSQDAVRVRPGMRVIVDGWSADAQALAGRVRLVEPGGFTKFSALGVEEQRVNIVVDPVGDEGVWAAFGDGYRAELQIVLWEANDVLIVPTGALFREGDGWEVFVVEGDVARQRSIELGRRNGLEAEVVRGLTERERVVLYPSELIADGTQLEVR